MRPAEYHGRGKNRWVGPFAGFLGGLFRPQISGTPQARTFYGVPGRAGQFPPVLKTFFGREKWGFGRAFSGALFTAKTNYFFSFLCGVCQNDTTKSRVWGNLKRVMVAVLRAWTP
jgi:hypothetical protein